jgi:hypothetical protein
MLHVIYLVFRKYLIFSKYSTHFLILKKKEQGRPKKDWGEKLIHDNFQKY